MSNRQCPKCGEEYSDTYKTCPFCEEEKAIQQGKPLRRRGGKRLEKRRRSGGAGGVMMLLTAVVIVGVVGYVFFGEQIAELAGIRTAQGDDQIPSGVLPASDGQTPANTPDIPDGSGTEDPEGSQEPNVPAGPLTLSQSDITIESGTTARLIASGGTGEVSWSTSNENIATVDGGAVTAVAGGTVTITATAGEETVSCKVTVTGDPWVSSANITLNKADVTLPASEKGFQLKVSGTDNPVTWTSNDTSVVTVSESGWVTWVGKGTTTVTASVDGHVMECIVRAR